MVTVSNLAVFPCGFEEWDVLWQMRGLALYSPRPATASSPGSAFEEAFCYNRALRLTLEPKCGLLACNGRPGHVQVLSVLLCQV